jgi:hypothetical protein
MGEASEFDDWLERHPLTPEETAQRDGPRPELRLRPEALSQALGPDAQVKNVLDRQVAETSEKRTAVLHDSKTGTTSIAVPLEQYLELVTSYIRDRDLAQLTLDNRAIPPDEALSELWVEQVDPQATWLHLE